MLCNRWELFCTFTFNGEKVDRYNFGECKKKLTTWLNNFRKRYAPDFRYMMIPEFHADGAIHFHGVVRGIPASEFYIPSMIMKRFSDGLLEPVPNTPGYVSWRRYEKAFGYFNCSVVRNRVGCAKYISKYVTKDLGKLPAGVQILLVSKGLEKPELVYDGPGVPDWEPEYSDDFCAMAFLSEADTLGGYLPEWYGECCSDLFDDDYVPEPALTVEQLSFLRPRVLIKDRIF